MTDLLPYISIIIPTYYRHTLLSECLDAIDQVEYPRDRFEVIVVNDGEEPPPEETVSRFQQSLNVRLFSQNHAGPAAARNHGASIARGEIYAFTDDDCLISKNWLLKLANRLSQLSNAVIGGRIQNMLQTNQFAQASQAIVDVVLSHFNADPSHAEFAATNNLALPSQLFKKIGGFNEDFRTSEDREFCDRLRHYGISLIYDPEVLIYHANPLTFPTFFKQHFNYGRGAHRFHTIRAQRNSGQLKPDFQFYRKLFMHPFRNGDERPFVRIALTITSQVANAGGYLWQGITDRWRKLRGPA